MSLNMKRFARAWHAAKLNVLLQQLVRSVLILTCPLMSSCNDAAERPAPVVNAWSDEPVRPSPKSLVAKAGGPTDSYKAGIRSVDAVVSGPFDTLALYFADSGNRHLAAAFEQILSRQWAARHFTVDLEFSDNEAIAEAALQWANENLATLSLSNAVSELRGLRIPLQIFMLPIRRSASREQDEENKQVARLYGLDATPSSVDADYAITPQGSPAVSMGSEFALPLSLDYVFTSYDPNTRRITLTASVPQTGVVSVPGRSDQGGIFDDDRPSIRIFPAFQGRMDRSVSTAESDDVWLLPRTSAADVDEAASQVARYPSPSERVHRIAVPMEGPLASRIKKDGVSLHVDHAVHIGFVWLVIPEALDVEILRRLVKEGSDHPPVKLRVVHQTRIEIGTAHVLGNKAYERLPTTGEWQKHVQAEGR